MCKQVLCLEILIQKGLVITKSDENFTTGSGRKLHEYDPDSGIYNRFIILKLLLIPNCKIAL